MASIHWNARKHSHWPQSIRYGNKAPLIGLLKPHPPSLQPSPSPHTARPTSSTPTRAHTQLGEKLSGHSEERESGRHLRRSSNTLNTRRNTQDHHPQQRRQRAPGPTSHHRGVDGVAPSVVRGRSAARWLYWRSRRPQLPGDERPTLQNPVQWEEHCRRVPCVIKGLAAPYLDGLRVVEHVGRAECGSWCVDHVRKRFFALPHPKSMQPHQLLDDL